MSLTYNFVWNDYCFLILHISNEIIKSMKRNAFTSLCHSFYNSIELCLHKIHLSFISFFMLIVHNKKFAVQIEREPYLNLNDRTQQLGEIFVFFFLSLQSICLLVVNCSWAILLIYWHCLSIQCVFNVVMVFVCMVPVFWVLCMVNHIQTFILTKQINNNIYCFNGNYLIGVENSNAS